MLSLRLGKATRRFLYTPDGSRIRIAGMEYFSASDVSEFHHLQF
jgi:hypothetical protein